MSREQRGFLWVCGLFVVLSVTYSFIIRLGFGPDEPRHWLYLPLLWKQHCLPRVLPDGTELGGAIALHPPLYYLLVSPAYLLGNALGGPLLAQRMIRGMSPLFGLAMLWLAWNSFGRVFGQRRGAALCAVALLALWPHILLDHSVINNDNLANLSGAAVAWFLVSRPGGAWSRRDALIGGVLLGIGALSKGQLLLCLPPSLAIMLAWDHGRDWYRQPAFWRNLGLTALAATLVCGWWYGRNFWLYGSINYVAPGYSGIPQGMGLGQAISEGVIGHLVLRAVGGVFLSVWCQVGWFPQASANLLYALLGVVLAGAAVGWVRFGLKLRAGQAAIEPRQLRDFAALCLPFAFIYLLLLYVSTFVHMGVYQGGRYALFAVGGFVAMLVAGWRQWLPERLRLPLGVALLALFLTMNLLCMSNLANVLNPTYAPGVTLTTPIPGG